MAERARLADSLKTVAVDAYVRGPARRILVALDAPSLQAAAARQQLVEVAVAKETDLADQLRAASEDLARQRDAAERARSRAESWRKRAETDLKSVERSRQAKAQVAVGVEDRLERALAEAASLETLDKQIASDITRRQAELARRLASVQPRPSRGRVTTGGSVATTSVRGIVVNVAIAGQLEALLAAAEGDGFNLSGGGYRSSDGQVAARRANCGSSNYDIYEKPASQCSPPTARPGQSMHEQGLAVDFTWNGRLITSRSNAAFQWLSGNASRFGLRNLPAEPWHWSTNGN